MAEYITVTVKLPGKNPSWTCHLPYGTSLPLDEESLDLVVTKSLVDSLEMWMLRKEHKKNASLHAEVG